MDTRERISQAAYALFYRKGFARVSVDAIAERAGVTKRTFYYHFQSKDAVIGEVLDARHAHMMSQFDSWLISVPSDPLAILTTLFQRLDAWANDPDWVGSGFSRVAAELADMKGHPARLAASRHKTEVERWLAERLREAKASDPALLASQVMTLIEGSMSLALLHGDRRYFGEALIAAKKLAT